MGFLSRSGSRFCTLGSNLVVPKTIEPSQRSHEEAALGHCGRGHTHFVQRVLAQQFEFAARVEDKGVAVFVEAIDSCHRLPTAKR